MTKEQRFGCAMCRDYVDPSHAGIGGGPMQHGRCKAVQKMLTRLKECPYRREVAIRCSSVKS